MFWSGERSGGQKLGKFRVGVGFESDCSLSDLLFDSSDGARECEVRMKKSYSVREVPNPKKQDKLDIGSFLFGVRVHVVELSGLESFAPEGTVRDGRFSARPIDESDTSWASISRDESSGFSSFTLRHRLISSPSHLAACLHDKQNSPATPVLLESAALYSGQDDLYRVLIASVPDLAHSVRRDTKTGGPIYRASLVPTADLSEAIKMALKVQVLLTKLASAPLTKVVLGAKLSADGELELNRSERLALGMPACERKTKKELKKLLQGPLERAANLFAKLPSVSQLTTLIAGRSVSMPTRSEGADSSFENRQLEREL